MIDIVERLRDNYTWLTRDGFDTSARNIADAANEHEAVVAERDSLRREVDALRSHQENVEATHRITLRDVQKEAMRLQSENDALRQQLAEKSAESDRRLDLMNTLDAENESLRKQLNLKMGSREYHLLK